jgi:hypothetical protein
MASLGGKFETVAEGRRHSRQQFTVPRIRAEQGEGGEGERLGLSEDMPGWDEDARARMVDRALIAPISKSLEKA